MIKEFGFRYAISDTFLFLFSRFKSFDYNKHHIKIVFRYIKRRYSKYISVDTNKLSVDYNDYKVFVCWWQGIDDKTPELVKKCIQNIQLKFKNHQVIVIDKNNVGDYISIPPYIIEKVSKGIISLTHLSDVIRFHLLSKYNGCWIDSTCWLSDNIEDELASFCFYTNKLKPEGPMLKYVSRGQWSGFFMKVNSNNVIINSVKNMLNAYWNEHNVVIDYLMFDYFIYITYLKSDEAKSMIDAVPFNNEHIHDLINLLNKEYDNILYLDFIKNTKIFKLTYKRDLSHRPKNSFYDVVLLKNTDF